MMTEEQILDLVRADPWMMQVLAVARSIDLPDWMIGAGFIRSKVWDHLHDMSRNQAMTADIDLIYFDPLDTSKLTEKTHDRVLTQRLDIDWSVKNQARMHVKNNRAHPFHNTLEALSEWVETPTSVAVKLDENDILRLFVPHGIDDLVNLIVRPTPAFQEKPDIYKKRLREKRWEKTWTGLRILQC